LFLALLLVVARVAQEAILAKARAVAALADTCLFLLPRICQLVRKLSRLRRVALEQLAFIKAVKMETQVAYLIIIHRAAALVADTTEPLL
jgi:hypothetical protein